MAQITCEHSDYSASIVGGITGQNLEIWYSQLAMRCFVALGFLVDFIGIP
jgi:hypothetical protein